MTNKGAKENNNPENTTQKTKVRATRTPQQREWIQMSQLLYISTQTLLKTGMYAGSLVALYEYITRLLNWFSQDNNLKQIC
jgi:acyl-CoA thioesterase